MDRSWSGGSGLALARLSTCDSRCRECGLTLRSSGHATACHAEPSFHSRLCASRRSVPLSSNVRPHMRTTRASRLGRRLRSSVYCLDCGVDTYKIEQYYMLRNGVWRSINFKRSGMLCLACAERRLGRPLAAPDFASVPVNAKQALLCPELALRLARQTPPPPLRILPQPRQRTLRTRNRE